MSAAAPLAVEPLDASRHDRSGFCCGVPDLDRYLRTQASQDKRRRVAAPYVLVASPSAEILGFYTLANASIRAAELPSTFVKALPRYPVLPATLLGRLAVGTAHRGRGFGTVLLLDALHRALRSESASLAVIVDAMDDAAASFYVHHEFIRLADHPRRLFKPMAEIGAAFAPSER